MITDEERRLIDNLFDRLAEAERRLPLREADAEGLINKRLTSQPSAPYYMAQAMMVQERALQGAQARIAQLEQEVQQARQNSNSGGFLSSLFGGNRQPAPPPQYSPPPAYGQPSYAQAPGGPWGGGYPQRGGGGFLAGAAQTAMGVAGGMLLADFIGDMFSGGAHAAAAGVTEINEITNIYEAAPSGLDATDASFSDPGLNDLFGDSGGDWDSTEI